MNYWVCADMHGDYRFLKRWAAAHPETKGDTIIILGDAGINYFFNHRDQEQKEKLTALGYEYFILRGNHEQRPSILAFNSPAEWVSEYYGGGKVWIEKDYPHIKYFADSVAFYTIDDKKVLCIPGAYSPDKWYRLQKGWSWFPEEQLSASECIAAMTAYTAKDYDYIFAHTCPYSWEPAITDLFMSTVAQKDIDKSTERWLDTFLSLGVHYDRFYFGHYHDTRDIPWARATMVYHEPILLGESIRSYQERCFYKELI